VAHAYNPSYLGDRNQADFGSKPAWANSSRNPISKKPITKKGWLWMQYPSTAKKQKTTKTKQ
jgi:hypothetical protein